VANLIHRGFTPVAPAPGSSRSAAFADAVIGGLDDDDELGLLGSTELF